jgi:lysophospholipase L1-like esterase
VSIIYSQSYDGTIIGALPSGWSPIDSANWAVSNTASISAPNSLVGPLSSGDGAQIMYTGQSALADMEVRYDVAVVNGFVGIILRGSADSTTAYIIIPDNAGTLNGQWDVYKRVSGSVTRIDTFSPSGLSGNISIRARIQGSTISIRVWDQGTAEPGSWTHQSTDGSITSAGYPGLYNQFNGSSGGSGVDNFTLDNLVSAFLAVSPTSVIASSTGNTLTLTGTGTSWTSGTPGLPTFTASGGTITAQHVTSATSATLTYTAPSSAGTVTITDPGTGTTAILTVLATAASDFTISPTSNATTPGVATGGYQVALNGALASNVSIALSDGGAGGAFSPSSPLTFTPGNAGTPRTVTYTPPGGSGAGTIPLGFSATGAFTASHAASCVVGTGPVTVAVSDPNLFFSPYNWRMSGSSFAISACNGAYMKMGFTGTSIKIALNIAGYAALYGNAALWPKVRWSIDDGAAVDHQLTSGDATLTLATGLPAGTHQLYFCMVSTTDGYDRWVGPGSAVIPTGFILDGGAETVAPPLSAMRVLFLGDSITEGVKTTGQASSGDIANNDSQLEWCALLGKAFPAEYGQVGYGGLGWISPSAGGSPPGAVPFFTPGNDTLSSWDKYSQGQSRLVSGLFSPAPDIICIMLGANDRTLPAGNVQASVTAALPAIRAAAPDAWIFVIYEVTTLNQKAAVLAGFDAYQAAAPDGKCAIVDCGIEAHFNFNDVPTDMAADGIHPAYYATGQIAGIVMKQIEDAMQGGGTATTAGYSRARVVNE